MSNTKILIHHFANILAAWQNCQKSNTHSEWARKHEETLDQLDQLLPSGSGFDSGSKLDREKSTPRQLIFNTSYHHMKEGFYTAWTDHVVVVTPSFIGKMNIKVSGKNLNDIKEYVGELFYNTLCEQYTQTVDGFEADKAELQPALTEADRGNIKSLVHMIENLVERLADAEHTPKDPAVVERVEEIKKFFDIDQCSSCDGAGCNDCTLSTEDN